MTKLNTTPSFVFEQGDMYDGCEQPLEVVYYNGRNEKAKMLAIRQGENEILITDIKVLQKLFKAVKKHLPDAKSALKR